MAADFLPPGWPSTGPVPSPPLQCVGHSSRASMDLRAVTAMSPLSGGQRAGGQGNRESFSIWECGLFLLQCQHSREWGRKGISG